MTATDPAGASTSVTFTIVVGDENADAVKQFFDKPNCALPPSDDDGDDGPDEPDELGAPRNLGGNCRRQASDAEMGRACEQRRSGD